MAKKEFPKGFLWGTAISAHQVEGGNKWNDWWEFEQAGFIANAQKSDLACDHYRRFKEDFDLARKLHLNGQRLSIEWSRLYKECGQVDQKEIEHYKEVLKYLKKNNFATFVTLHHFTNPIWFTEKGGWEKKENIKYFLDFVELCSNEFSDLIDFWTTFNEPFAPYSTLGYLKGIWPPQKKQSTAFYRAVKNIITTHNKAARIIKKEIPKAQVGIVYNLHTFFPTYFFEKPFRRPINYIRNWWFLDQVICSCDFLGVNYYFPIRFFKTTDKKTEMGWEVNPAGFYDSLIKGYKRYQKPVYVTENGIANARDDMRTSYITNHISKMHDAITDGADVRGYFHWSLMDNFEWTEGYYRKFGLYDVNFKNQERIKRPSADVYAKIAKENSITV